LLLEFVALNSALSVSDAYAVSQSTLGNAEVEAPRIEYSSRVLRVDASIEYFM
jgi:hypothetical protein